MRLPQNLRHLDKYSKGITKEYTKQNRLIEYKREAENGAWTSPRLHSGGTSGNPIRVASIEHLPARQMLNSKDSYLLDDFLRTQIPGQDQMKQKKLKFTQLEAPQENINEGSMACLVSQEEQ